MLRQWFPGSLASALAGITRLSASAAIMLVLALGSAQSNAFDACLPAPARLTAAAERTVAIETPDGRILGTLAAPADGMPAALALLLHGYTGSRNEIPVAGGEGMFARTARLFAERGIATLRIDFIGSGKSDGVWADTRFSGQARDAIQAAAALQERFRASDLPLGVLGYSQGGLVALRAAAQRNVFDKLALWNPVMDPMATYQKIFGRETILDGAQRHAEGGDQAVVADTRLRPGFFSELVAADPIADAARMAAPILIVTGQKDPLVENGATLASRLQAGRTAATTILDLEAGHDLGAIREPALLDAVIACTAGFLLTDLPK